MTDANPLRPSGPGVEASRLPTDRADRVKCHSGGRSAIYASQLAEAGFADVATASGGMAEWSTAGLPLDSMPGGGWLQSLLSAARDLRCAV